MKRFHSSEIKEKLNLLNIEEGDTLFIHNSLLKFGLPIDKELSLLPKLFFDVISEKIGESGTIIVPTFNFDFCSGKDFDRQNTSSKKMGVFSEYVRQLDEATRSTHPMQSVAVIGKHKLFLTEEDTVSAFSKESAFDRMLTLNTKVLLLGTEFDFNSIVHWVEEREKVPYRYWKSFTANYTDDGETTERTYQMFVRDLKLDPKIKLYPIEKEMKKNNMLTQAALGGGVFTLYQLNDFVNITQSLISSNPYVLIENHPDYAKHSR